MRAIVSTILGEEAKQKIIGQPFIDLTLNDVNGVSHKLSEYCGKGTMFLSTFGQAGADHVEVKCLT